MVQVPQLPCLGRPQAAARGLIGLAALLFIAVPIAAQAATITSAAAAPVTVGHVNAGRARVVLIEPGPDSMATKGQPRGKGRP